MGLSESTRALLAILLLSGGTMGAVWGYTWADGPLRDEPPPYFEEDGIFLVSFQSALHELTSEVQIFPLDGVLVFSGLTVPVRNVTTVEVTVQVAMDGPAVNDQYDVTVTDPTGEERTGSHEVPNVSPAGYMRSDTIISWPRTQQPRPESHRTPDPAKAAAWSAANHTDDSAEGTWTARVELNQPIVGREGNASLVLRFRHYEAIVLPQTRPTDASPGTGPSDPDVDDEDDPVAAALRPSRAAATPGFGDLPRTFITPRPVGVGVDRGRTADRPL